MLTLILERITAVKLTALPTDVLSLSDTLKL